MIDVSIKHHVSIFRSPGGTSRGILTEKDSWFVTLLDTETKKKGVGEISVLPGLSIDDISKISFTVKSLSGLSAEAIELANDQLSKFPAVQFGIETALLDLQNGGTKILFPSDFTNNKKGIQINGLIWMGHAEIMRKQIDEKIEAGFTCLKLKVGAIHFETEIELLQSIRNRYDAATLEIRVDANGSFSHEKAPAHLAELAQLGIHSIEQPIRQGYPEQMSELCAKEILPIALDEELIGCSDPDQLLSLIQPQYIILKPSLIGGLKASERWISAADANQIGWWATSALETNIGLNAIAQWCYNKNVQIPQGLGTGGVFTNNIDSPLYLQGEKLFHNPETKWGFR